MAVANIQATLTLDDIPFSVLGFVEEQRLGRPAELSVRLDVGLPYDADTLVGKRALFELKRRGAAPRYFHGVVDEATVIGTAMLDATEVVADNAVMEVELHVVPWIAVLAHVQNSEIFQELDVQGVVTKVLEEHGVPSAEMDWRLTGSYPVRTYCVQYQESVLDFVSRLLEEEGIYYAFEMSPDGAKIVFSDDSTAADALEGGHRLPFRPDASMDVREDHLRRVDERHRVRSGKFVLRDYDFERPKLDQTVEVESDADTDLERYDYPGMYTEPSEGKRLAQVKLEAEQVERYTLLVEADCPRLVPGRKIEIEEALDEVINGEWLVVGTVQELRRRRTAEQMEHDVGAAGTAEETYEVRAVLLPADRKYRCPQVTPVPVAEGPHSAVVVAPEGAQAEEIHTDEWGRCKVKFQWDLSEEVADKASCWMRTKQAQTSGSMVLPRVGWEVIVEHLEGHPDRPFVVGRMYNGTFMPPYALPEGRSRTALKTHSTPGGSGYNEVRFEDKAGGEEIYIHAAYDMVVHAANNKTKSVMNREAKTVAVDSSTSVGGNQKVQITKGNDGTVGADQKLTVGGNRKVEVNALQALNVGGGSSNTVGGNHFEMDGDPLTALVNIAVEKATEVVQAKAAEQMAKLDEYVQSKVDQVMAPINDMQGQVEKVAAAMDAVGQGQLSETTTAMREAAALPQIDELGSAMQDAAFGGSTQAGDAMGVEVGPRAEGAEGVSAQTGLDQVVNGAIAKGVRAGGDVADAGLHDLFGEALGLEGSGGGGESAANLAGPELDQAGIDETDRAKGPGHALYVVEGDLSESVGSLKTSLAITGINTQVAGNMTQSIGAARVIGAVGDSTETIDGNKTETCVGLVVYTKGDASETVGGTKTCMVGGAIVDRISGGQTVEASGPATFIGALHKVEASEKITFKVGGSEVVIEGGGIVLKAPIISVLSPKIQLTKKAAQNS